MKTKILLIMMIMVVTIILGTINSLAAGNIEINVQGQTTIKETEKTIELTLSLGNFTEIEEGIPLGYQGTLTYDENMFESIAVEGLNGWTVNYEDSTNVFMGETDTAKANTQIAKVTLTLKDGVTLGTSGTINFNNILLTDGTNDFTFNKEITITVENEENNDPNEGNEEDNQETGTDENNTIDEPTNTNVSTNSTSIQGSNTDRTTATTKLPAAGLRNIVIIAVVIMIIFMVVFKIKSKDIKY